MIRALQADDVDACESILRALPEWFGIEQSIREYVRDLSALETFVAAAGGEVIGFLALRSYGDRASDIHVMAVRRDRQGRGVGRALVEHAQRRLQHRSVEFLQVKTLGPSRPNAAYERTRGFYLRLGFVPLEENDLWGDVNPCLILVKHLPCSGSS